MIIGIESSCAVISPVIVFPAPGPDVTNTAAGLPSAEPDEVYVEGVAYKLGSVASLNAGEWGWDGVSSPKRIYIKHKDGTTDPNTLTVIEDIVYIREDPYTPSPRLLFTVTDDILAIDGGIVKVIERRSKENRRIVEQTKANHILIVLTKVKTMAS